MSKRRRNLDINQFKGLSTQAVTLMQPTLLRKGQNFVVNDAGHLEKVWGSRKAFSGHGLTNITELFYHKQTSSILFAVGNGKLMKFEGGSWSELGTDLVGGGAVWFQSYLDNPYFFFGGNSYFYDVATGTLNNLDTVNKTWFTDEGGDLSNYISVRGIHPVIHFNALWIAGSGEFRNIVFYTQSFSNIFSDIGVGGLPTNLFVSVGGDDSASGSTFDEITGMEEVGQELFITKNNSCHRMVGVSTAQYRSIPISEDVGCTAPKSLVRTKIGVIFYHSKSSGIWVYDGRLRNLSRPHIDTLLAEISDPDEVRASVFRNRYYLLSIGEQTLIYDMDTDAWMQDSQNYGALEHLGSQSDIFIGAINEYSTSLVSKIDPLRPLETQEVLERVATVASIVEIGRSTARNMDEDGTGGETIDFDVSLPYLDLGTKSKEKVFMEVLVHYKCGDPVLTLDARVDGRIYEGLTAVSDPKPLFGEAIFGESSFNDTPLYEAKFLLPFDASGYGMSLRLNVDTNKALRIENIIIYYLMSGRYEEAGE